jgi:hypothetical protein
MSERQRQQQQQQHQLHPNQINANATVTPNNNITSTGTGTGTGSVETPGPGPRPRPNKKNPMLRKEYVVLLVLVSFLFVKQLRSPLEEYAGVELNFKTPAVIREREFVWQAQQKALEFEEEDEPLVEYDFSNDSHDYESHDSHDVIIQELTPPALKLIEDYTYYHSSFKMEKQAEECSERTNRKEDESLSHAMDHNWCTDLSERAFLVVTFHCDEDEWNEPVDGLQDFLRSMAWAVVTGRTLLYKPSFEVDTADCGDEDCSKLCDGIAELDPWVPHFDDWNREYEWFVDASIDIPVLDISNIESSDAPKLATLEHPPPLSLDYLTSSASKEKAQRLIDFKMAYGMILDESILMEEPEIVRLRSSSEDQEVTSHYAIDGSAKCPLDLEEPCVIFQVGDFPVETNQCRVERVTTGDPHSKRTMFHTLARAGNGWDGASLDMNNPLSELLLELLQYRGRLERGADFELKTCLREDHEEEEKIRYLR